MGACFQNAPRGRTKKAQRPFADEKIIRFSQNALSSMGLPPEKGNTTPLVFLTLFCGTNRNHVPSVTSEPSFFGVTEPNWGRLLRYFPHPLRLAAAPPPERFSPLHARSPHRSSLSAPRPICRLVTTRPAASALLFALTEITWKGVLAALRLPGRLTASIVQVPRSSPSAPTTRCTSLIALGHFLWSCPCQPAIAHRTIHAGSGASIRTRNWVPWWTGETDIGICSRKQITTFLTDRQ